ncbi:endo alpha-1,4 polygalactosaminidase [Roseibium sediminicola]|uniref:Endo alpha-1,4 polygalactosaminidase n=1 Tax=Roseibium sediminicola TaxID=2933272 RepID=A0ABT0GQ64_9HYPH|nr:endo alpha-1,4 polygalactosaminidase [Roseibium sp. CAU 1639]MCK7611456.1 endo alpha-1,4 polygalactosaminidase [Roseibium sp. CAU 1639]
MAITGSLLLAPASALAFSVGDSWDWQLTEPVDLNRAVDVLDLHPELVTAEDIAELRAKGIKTICYVSVGTLERTSPDRGTFPQEVVGKTYGDWPDEKFLDIRRIDVLLPLMTARFESCKAKGFDAIEPDNMDVHDNDSGFPVTARHTVAYVRLLAATAQGLGLKIGQKNVPDLTEDLVDTFDFAISESCYQDRSCKSYLAYTEDGKPVFDAEYTDRPIHFSKACAIGRKYGLSMILKDRDLTAPVLWCPDENQ